MKKRDLSSLRQIVLLLGHLQHILCSAPRPASVVGNASTSKEFFSLLGQPGIKTIFLTNDISLNLVDAPLAPVNLTNDLTIAAGLPAPQVASLAANYIASKIRLAPQVTLVFERIILSGTLRGTGQHLDLLTRSDGGAVVYNRTINHRHACLPFGLFYEQLSSLPPPLHEAGLPFKGSRKISLVNGTYCWLSAAAQNMCMMPYLDMLSYGTYNQIIDGVIGNGGYNSFFIQSYSVCDREISDECIKQKNADLCLAAALANGGAPPPADEPDPHESDFATRLGVGLGVGLGGALLLAVVLIAVFARTHWRYRREAALGGGAGASSSKTALRAASLSAAAAAAADVADLEIGSGGAGRKLGSPGGAAAAPAATGGGAADSDASGGKSGLEAQAATGRTAAMGSSSADSSSSSSGSIEAAAVPAVQRAGTSEGGPAGSGAGLGEVEAARLNLLANAARGRAARGAPLDVKVLQPLGQGSFGKVYKGIWHGTLVALKAQVLPPSLSGDARRRHMAVMEAAISSAINHPAIVQTYCYSFRPIKGTVGRTVVKQGKTSLAIGGEAEEDLGAGDAAAGEGGGGGGAESAADTGGEDYGHELLLVLEYCDGGSLRAALDKGAFHQGRPWPWNWRRAIQAAGQAAAAGEGAAAADGQRPAMPPLHRQYHNLSPPSPAAAAAAADVATAATHGPFQGNSAAIANLVAVMARGSQSIPPVNTPDSRQKHSGPSSVVCRSDAAAPSSPSALLLPPGSCSGGAGSADAGVAAVSVGDGNASAAHSARAENSGGGARRQIVGAEWTAGASDLASSAWPKLDSYEPDFTHGAFEVVLPATVAADGADGGDDNARPSAAAAATTLDVFYTLAGAPTAATSFMSSFSNAFGAGTSAADNAAAAAAADRLAMMYLLQQAASAVAAGADPTVGSYAKMLADYISSSNLVGLNTTSLAAELAVPGDAAAAAAAPPPASNDGAQSSDGTLVAPPPAVLAATAAAAMAEPVVAAASISSPMRVQASLQQRASSGAASTEAGGGAAAAASTGSAQQPQQQPPPPAIRYGLMLAVAADVASGLLHLHGHGVVHGDVKASNVLLKQIVVSDPLEAAGRAMDSAISYGTASAANGIGGTAPSSAGLTGAGGASDLHRAASVESMEQNPRLGLCAKVSDFGLSTMLSTANTDTHISASTAAGSLSHMSPELLLCGHVSKANDVYAYGILLFEIFTGERAWEGMPRALLPARVALEGWRPLFPAHTPAAYRQLAERCVRHLKIPAYVHHFQFVCGFVPAPLRLTHAAELYIGGLAAIRTSARPRRWFSFSTSHPSKSAALPPPGYASAFEEVVAGLKELRDRAASELLPEWLPVANPQTAFLQQLLLQRRPTGAHLPSPSAGRALQPTPPPQPQPQPPQPQPQPPHQKPPQPAPAQPARVASSPGMTPVSSP